MRYYQFLRFFVYFIFLFRLTACVSPQKKDQLVHLIPNDDSIYARTSGIKNISLSADRVLQLKKTAIVWGILKYFHPSLSSGKVSSDPMLFRQIKKMVAGGTEKTDSLLTGWIDGLEMVQKMEVQEDVQYSNLLSSFSKESVFGLFSSALSEKLISIRKNYRYRDSNMYVRFNSPVGNPVFVNESSYTQVGCPDLGIRLLALFRYWNIIEYYYPYRYLLGRWESILDKYIPIFCRAETPVLYTQACMELIAEVGDTHASIFGTGVIDSLKGVYICPFQAKYIENKLVVTKVYNGNNSSIVRGDVVQSIDKVTPEQSIAKYKNRISASNYSAFLKLLFSGSGYALRGNHPKAEVVISRNGRSHALKVDRINVSDVSPREDWTEPVSVGFARVNDSIGYIYPELLKRDDYRKIVEDFSSMKGLIVDMRCYPAVFLPSFLCTWLGCDTTPFAKVRTILKDKPGFLDSGTLIRINNTDFPPNVYFKGKLVILINSSTISQSEYATMALSHRKQSVVIGSETAGADGDLSSIDLPGGIKTLVSGTAIFYPDNKATQRVGIVPQIMVERTLNSVKNNVDNQFAAALDYLTKK